MVKALLPFLTLHGSLLLWGEHRFHVEVFERLDDMGADHGLASEAPLVQDANIQGRGIQLLLGQVLHGRRGGEGRRERRRGGEGERREGRRGKEGRRREEERGRGRRGRGGEARRGGGRGERGAGKERKRKG